MIQDIAPSVFHNEYEPLPPRESDTVFVFGQKQVIASQRQDGGFVFPEADRFETDLRYLFRIDEQRYYLYLPELPEKRNGAHDPFETALLESGFEYVSLTQIRKTSEHRDMFACMTAYHLFVWYDKNRICGRCGMPLHHSEKERALRCPSCGNMVFPTIAPAVIVGVTDGDQLLMTKYADRPYTGWALIAGFCEIGETVEDTVRREVLEEAGVHVKNLRYEASQPWGVDSNLLVGVFCDADGDKTIHMDREELSRAVWVDRADVPVMKDNHSLTGHMIELFRTGKR